MNSIASTFILSLCCSLIATGLRAVEADFTPLLDRDHTQGWVPCGHLRYDFKDGVATVAIAKDSGALWYSPATYSDFDLRLEYKGVGRDFNSGVYIRFPHPGNNPQIPIKEGNEVQICDGLNHDQPTGSIFNFHQPVSVPQRTAEWNEMEIIAVGPRVIVKLNGQSITDYTGLRQFSGYIGLQAHHHGPVQFRNIRIKDLSAAAPQLTVANTQALAIDPHQPLLQALSQLAPTASDWVLTPLDEGVPANIRKNLTYLREDLLDEYKQKPKASVEAYKLAHQLCTTMIAALDERDQSLVRAGYRAAQADTTTGISQDQALSARRNYMMSWPQYARERDQRRELKNQAENNAQLMKEAPKVEWSNRTAVLRKTLDDLYARFREALR